MGVEAVRRTVRAAIEIGVQYLTIFSFSSENWARPGQRDHDLMGLMPKRFIRRDLAELHQNNVRVRVIGEREGVEPGLGMIDEAVALTSANTALDLVIAFNYGSRAEIAGAARRLARLVADGTITPEEITPEALSAALEHAGRARSRPAQYAPAASCGCPASCYGSRPTRSSCFWKPAGRNSDAIFCSRPSTSFAAATAGSAASLRGQPVECRHRSEAHERARQLRAGRRCTARLDGAPRQRLSAAACRGPGDGRRGADLHSGSRDAVCCPGRCRRRSS